MTISEKQLEANRQNAKLGGVKTEEGKKKSKFNAIKHGLFSKEVLLEGEDAETLSNLQQNLMKELKPASYLELILVQRIISGIWRLKRVLLAEREIIENELKDNSLESLSSETTKNVGKVFHSDLSYRDSFTKLGKYENGIERSVYKALNELKRLKSDNILSKNE
jgi:hypothetical protein